MANVPTWMKPSVSNSPDLDCVNCVKASKCCDFQPFIPNYVLGALLERSFRLRDLMGEHNLQPLGLVPAKSFRVRHENTPKEMRGVDLNCLFYDRMRGLCRIWDLRPGECRTYFCEAMTGAHKKHSFKLFRREVMVAQMALRHVGFTLPEIHQQVDVLNLAGEWRSYNPTELVGIYRSAWSWASQLTANDVREFA